MAGGGAGGDAPDAQASALGLPYGQPQPPKRLAHHGIQRITVEFSEKSPHRWRFCAPLTGNGAAGRGLSENATAQAIVVHKRASQ